MICAKSSIFTRPKGSPSDGHQNERVKEDHVQSSLFHQNGRASTAMILLNARDWDLQPRDIPPRVRSKKTTGFVALPSASAILLLAATEVVARRLEILRYKNPYW